MSINLGAAQLSGGMANPETAVNTATGRLDAAITEIMTVDLTNDVTLTTTQYQSAFRFDVTPSGVAKTLTLPAVKRMALIRNTSANDISVVCGTTTLALGPTSSGLFYTDGTANGLEQMDVNGVKPFDMGIFIPGKPDAGAIVLRFKVVRAFTLPANLTGSYASAGVASTSSTTTFTIKNNGTSIGTIVFNVSDAGTFTFASDVDFAVGDVITITAPTPVDASLQDIALNLLGNR